MADLKLNLPNFEGPLDLLLHLIKSQKIDIYDIPIAQITNQFLEYLRQMQQLNLNLAGEYFVMASTLLRIKSSLLLPKNNYADDEDLPDDFDPRQELVDQLVQYELFQKISAYLDEKDKATPKVLVKDPTPAPKNLTKPLPKGIVDANELAGAFAMILRRFHAHQPQQARIEINEISLDEQIAELQSLIAKNSELSFFDLVKDQFSFNYVVSMFLAVLELIKKNVIIVEQHKVFDDLIIKRVEVNE